jgi:hypothetical protein
MVNPLLKDKPEVSDSKAKAFASKNGPGSNANYQKGGDKKPNEDLVPTTRFSLACISNNQQSIVFSPEMCWTRAAIPVQVFASSKTMNKVIVVRAFVSDDFFTVERSTYEVD